MITRITLKKRNTIPYSQGPQHAARGLPLYVTYWVEELPDRWLLWGHKWGRITVMKEAL
jgi:hypothetical protein